MLNRVILMGRLTRDPDLRETAQGLRIARFTVVVDRYSKSGDKADFISCTAFGQKAEFIERYFGKGRMIALEGSLKTGSYEKDGATVYTTEVWVDQVSFTGEPKPEQRDSWQQEHDAQIYQQTQAQTQSSGARYPGTEKTEPLDLTGFEDVLSDEGVPF